MSKILIIEDNDDIRDNIAEVLSYAGYKILTANNGKTGIELAMQQLPDIILCDIMMPGIDGYGVLHAMNKNEKTRPIPFIFITAKSERADIRKGMELGADDYLTKPFDDNDLIKAIETRLKKKEIQYQIIGKSPQVLNTIVSRKNGFEELKNIIKEHNAKKYNKDQTIHYEGDRAAGIYYIISGKVKIVRLAEDGRELITGIYDTDDFMDLNIMLSTDTYDDTAVAMEEAIISYLPSNEFDKLLNLYPDIGTKFIKMLSNNIREKEIRLLQIAYQSVRKRIAETLLKLSKQRGGDGKSIKISRDDLAAISATAPETVSRTLTDFKNEKLIEKNGNYVVLTNPEAIAKLKN